MIIILFLEHTQNHVQYLDITTTPRKTSMIGVRDMPVIKEKILKTVLNIFYTILTFPEEKKSLHCIQDTSHKAKH